MKALGFLTPHEGGAGGFRMHYLEVWVRVRTPVEPPLILKDDAGTPPSPPQTHLIPWNQPGTLHS